MPGGSSDRGIEGMIVAAQYARTHKVPYFGICLGMQIAVGRVCTAWSGLGGRTRRNSTSFTKHLVIDIMPEQKTVTQKGRHDAPRAHIRARPVGGHARLVSLYGKTEISSATATAMSSAMTSAMRSSPPDLVPTGLSPDGRLVEIVEPPDHLWFTACQFHPEFKAAPTARTRCSSAL